jgi:multidrug efflux pump
VKSKKGNLVRLDTLAQFELGNAALTVNHFNENPCTTISFNLDKKMSLGEAVSKIEELEISLKRPQSITGVFQGTTQAFKAMQTQTIWLILASVITMYMILGMLYESYIHPITILSSLPTAGIGALIALIITGMNLDVISLIGLIMLIGIVKKNAIMMIDYSLVEERIHHKSPENAIIEAAHRRFRPIMMTTLAAIMGILPITFGLGAGAELRQPLGIAVAGGLLVSQVLTLYITPVIYIYLDKLSKRFTH